MSRQPAFESAFRVIEFRDATTPDIHILTFDFALEGTTVDADKGVIKNVSVITDGVEARGHDLKVDKTTCEQICEWGLKRGKVPCKTNHKTGADAINGYLKNFRLDDSSGKLKVKADWHLLKRFKDYAHILEMAQEMPECFGLSAAFMGKGEPDGSGGQLARCSELMAVDLVAQPAANPDGLLHDARANGREPVERVDAAAQVMPANTPAKEVTLSDLAALITAQNERLNTFEQTLNSIAFDDDDDDDGEYLIPGQLYEDENGVFTVNEQGERVAAEAADDDDAEGEDKAEEGDKAEGDGEESGAPEGAQLSRKASKAIELAVQATLAKQGKKQAAAHAFSNLEEKITLLGDKLADSEEHILELQSENDALRTALTEGTGGPIHFSADGTVNIPALRNGEQLTEFEQRQHELKAAHPDKSGADIIQLAMAENGGGKRFRDHQKAKGIIK